MHILMLGNSFTFANDMRAMLSEITGAEVVHHTRGGACFLEQLNQKTKLGKKTEEALVAYCIDHVVTGYMRRRLAAYSQGFSKTREKKS